MLASTDCTSACVARTPPAPAASLNAFVISSTDISLPLSAALLLQSDSAGIQPTCVLCATVQRQEDADKKYTALPGDLPKKYVHNLYMQCPDQAGSAGQRTNKKLGDHGGEVLLRVSRSMAPTPLKILSMSIMPVRASIALCCMLTCSPCVCISLQAHVQRPASQISQSVCSRVVQQDARGLDHIAQQEEAQCAQRETL